MIIGSVGRNGYNLPVDVAAVQRQLNAHAAPGQAMIPVDGEMSGPLVALIEKFHNRAGFCSIAPVGIIIPGTPPAQALGRNGQGVPMPLPPPPPDTNIPPKPPRMRESAWRYLLRFTKAHEGKVLHMFNGDPITLKGGGVHEDVTCGIGFSLWGENAAVQPDIKEMFFDPTIASKPQPTDDQMRADYRAAKGIVREWTEAGMKRYFDACHMRMDEDKVVNHWGKILKNQKLPLLNHPQMKDDYADFDNFPAVAQVAIASFLYGNNSLGFPGMREAIRAKRFDLAAQRCALTGMKGGKNERHRDLFLYADKVLKENRSMDDLPPITKH